MSVRCVILFWYKDQENHFVTFESYAEKPLGLFYDATVTCEFTSEGILI